MPTDIFDTPPWDNDDTCLIVGSGPTLATMPLDLEYDYDVTIALNKAALFVKGDYWLCAAPGLLHEQWFKDRMDDWFGYDDTLRVFYAQPIFLTGPLTYAYPDVPYTFNEGGDVKEGDPCRFGVLKYGVTVAGRAIQLAYLKGIRDITLVGVDQRTRLYFDSTENTKTKNNPDDTWPTVANLNMLISYVQGNGCKVRSLTPTALDVEVTG